VKKVLVVDDTKNIRNLLTTCLELEGYQVMTADSGPLALELLRNRPFDLLFLDIKLPELSGTEVLRRMRQLGLTIPVVIMTAFATVKNAVECTKLGAVVYLQKPFTAEKVRGILRELAVCPEDDPSQVKEFLEKAKSLLNVGKPNEAYDLLKKGLSIEPNCGEVYCLLAEVFEKLGNAKEAKRFKAMAANFGDS